MGSDWSRLCNRCKVNQLWTPSPLKEGEEIFIEHAKLVRKYGAAVVVMAFDEVGRADTEDRKVEICSRAYDILRIKSASHQKTLFSTRNIFAIGTGLKNTTTTVSILSTPQVVLNVRYRMRKSRAGYRMSLSFRGNNVMREAIHAVFLYHAIKQGMDMGIVNAG